MRNLLVLAATALVALGGIDRAQANCAADANLSQVRQRYADGQAQEKAGHNGQALQSYIGAQAYICEPNPVEADAAARAAVLARPIAESWEKNGDLESAYRVFESGGLFADADRVMVTILRAKPDEIYAYDRAREHFAARAEESFAINNKVRLAATGGYQLDQRLHTEVMGWPLRACERALQREAQAFSEEYLKDVVALERAKPDDPTDFAGMQAAQEQFVAFNRKWPENQVKTSQSLLQTAFQWATRVSDAAMEGQLVARIRGTVAKRAQTLVQRYFGAPELLAAAIDYYLQNQHPPQVLGVKARARQLGQDAAKRGALRLASEYYEVSDNDAKRQAAIARLNAQAQTKQAEEMRRAMQKSQAQNSAKSADELERELGM